MIYLVAAPDLLDPLMMQLTPPTSCPIEMIVRRRFAEITLAPNAKRDPPNVGESHHPPNFAFFSSIISFCPRVDEPRNGAEEPHKGRKPPP